MDKSFFHDALKSEPPAKSLTLQEVYKGKYMMVPYELPSGDYIPKLENKKGYFFEAPSQLKITDLFFPRRVTGGIFWRRDADQPEWIYYYKVEFKDLLKDIRIADKVTISKRSIQPVFTMP